ncbi:MAG: ATP-binding protein [Candidatus Omnitrophica bacterium]|nr:ATP-binding protein [Candidatus Omnitrophota bacterium]MBU4302867.1 ATP-binding protein [Candidatus Omnitrophota bacterium]MBU4419016.1 ATP-binding protein [Candidatus Omnitrophota bacterium]MBU4468737.1 ATP-binding protein [Candidatus Omnitrophota bacterium]MCG2708229.1 ATP-binding protein [Candidatus Omnitrophota bacterium]
MKNITVLNPSTIKSIRYFLASNKFFPILDNEERGVYFPKDFVLIAPFALAMIAAWAEECYKSKNNVKCLVDKVENPNVLNYAWRMHLMDFMKVAYNPGSIYKEHEPSGRFIPLARIDNSEELRSFLVDMLPLLHIPIDESNALKYCFSELIRNVIEHAGGAPAFACAQYYKKSRKISIGIADCGKGILASLRRTQRYLLDKEHKFAIIQALKPGISGGSSIENAGAGLYFVRSIAKASGTQFAVYSGDTCYKLTQKRKGEDTVFNSDPLGDRHNLYESLPYWQGTVIAVEIGLENNKAFDEVLTEIRRTFYKNRIKNRKRGIRFE